MKDVSITLVNESCFSFLKELESNSIDLALIDPPYEVSRETNFKSGEAKGKDTDRFRVSMDFGDWDSDFTGLDEVIKELYRVLRKGGTLICFYDIWKISILRRYFDDAKFRQIRFIEWVKTNPVPINSKINYLTNAREIAVVAVKEGKATFHSEYDNGIYRYPICHDRERFHPTQKPLALIEELVIKHSKDCIKTGKRYDARRLGYKEGWVVGDENTSPCIGCYWYDPKRFNQLISKDYKKEK